MELIAAEDGDAVHLHDSESPVLEIRGQLHRIEGPPIEPGGALESFRAIAPQDELREIKANGLASFEFLHANAVFRVMAFREEATIRVELRIVARAKSGNSNAPAG